MTKSDRDSCERSTCAVVFNILDRDFVEKVITFPRFDVGGMHCFTPVDLTARYWPSGETSAQYRGRLWQVDEPNAARASRRRCR